MPPTDDELTVLEEADKYGLKFYGPIESLDFWAQSPEEREAVFFYLKNLVRETREFLKRQAKTAANGR